MMPRVFAALASCLNLPFPFKLCWWCTALSKLRICIACLRAHRQIFQLQTPMKTTGMQKATAEHMSANVAFTRNTHVSEPGGAAHSMKSSIPIVFHLFITGTNEMKTGITQQHVSIITTICDVIRSCMNGWQIARYLSMARHDRWNMEMVHSMTSKLVPTRHSVSPSNHCLLLSCWQMENGITSTDTLMSATASDTTKALVIVRSRRWVATDRMTTVLPARHRMGNSVSTAAMAQRVPDSYVGGGPALSARMTSQFSVALDIVFLDEKLSASYDTVRSSLQVGRTPFNPKHASLYGFVEKRIETVGTVRLNISFYRQTYRIF